MLPFRPFRQGDNPRERALEMMMYGRLEANAEEELFKVSVQVFFACCGTGRVTSVWLLIFWVGVVVGPCQA